MDAIEFLETDHKAAKKVIEEIAKSPVEKKKALFSALKLELELHDRIEETIFYPAVLTHPLTSGLPGSDKQAHETVEAALARLAELPVENPDWSPSFSAMQDKLFKHIKDEESDFFVKIRAALSATELNALGDKMKAEKESALK